MIAPMIPGNASAAFKPDLPSNDAKALSLFLNHSFTPFSSLGGGGDAAPHPHHQEAMLQEYTDSHEYGSNPNALLSKQHPYLVSQ